MSTHPVPRAEPAPTALSKLLGDSLAMRDVRRRLGAIARAQGSVLVQGDSGTGKELAARVVHDLSPRAAGPFVAIDCGALSEGVLESELFGHARGAFTNATGDRRGLFEAASGGTIFLDEIANTTLALQARLLRVLQEREVRRVGCNVARPVDVRVIAATNRDLAADARAGSFRLDLLYRLDVLSVRMPSLADRLEDVEVIARSVLGELAPAGLRVTEEAWAALRAHDWPGNVRELRNALERAAAFADSGVIGVEHLPDTVLRRSCGDVMVAPASGRRPLQDMLDDFERRLLLARLSAHGWNRTRTAAELGITRRTLFTKMLKHGIAETRWAV